MADSFSVLINSFYNSSIFMDLISIALVSFEFNIIMILENTISSVTKTNEKNIIKLLSVSKFQK